MTQEDKELLLKDLSGRLRYGVMLWHSLAKKPFKLESIIHRNEKTYVQEEEGGPIIFDEYGSWRINGKYFLSEFIKPYLRPMSSMTEEEEKEWQYYKSKIAESCDELLEERIADCHNFFNRHHLDYRGLIPKGLAIEVTEENNPYK